MTPQPDFKFKEALELIDEMHIALTSTGSTVKDRQLAKTVRIALLIADALMQEPSEEAIKAGLAVYDKIGCGCEDCDKSFIQQQFEAMRNELLKGIL